MTILLFNEFKILTGLIQFSFSSQIKEKSVKLGVFFSSNNNNANYLDVIMMKFD